MLITSLVFAISYNTSRVSKSPGGSNTTPPAPPATLGSLETFICAALSSASDIICPHASAAINTRLVIVMSSHISRMSKPPSAHTPSTPPQPTAGLWDVSMGASYLITISSRSKSIMLLPLSDLRRFLGLPSTAMDVLLLVLPVLYIVFRFSFNADRLKIKIAN